MSNGEKRLHGDRPAYPSACSRLTRFRSSAKPCIAMNDKSNPNPRVVGFDAHPDTFTAALVRGPTPAAAVTEKVFNKIPMRQLKSWARKHTAQDDLFLLIIIELEGNLISRGRFMGRAELGMEGFQQDLRPWSF